jgi:exopolyphosphatase/guanosine-5'-triphosphate,3'-diphosphate pyrophosphatase
MPAARHSPFQTFDADSRRAINFMTPLLRIADSLDRSHEQRVAGMDVQLRNGSMSLALQSPVDLDLELWAVERVADVFRETYEMSLTLNKVKA